VTEDARLGSEHEIPASQLNVARRQRVKIHIPEGALYIPLDGRRDRDISERGTDVARYRSPYVNGPGDDPNVTVYPPVYLHASEELRDISYRLFGL
jgi:hypothetical protein